MFLRLCLTVRPGALGRTTIAHDRRGHGRSTQTVMGNEMNTYAADVAELVAHLDLHNAVHIGGLRRLF